jgi:NADPH:quinone reductase-like Zn-dependent oxidoreductase
MRSWDLLIDKADLTRTQLREGPAPDAAALAEGEVLLAVERFALTANNITYGAIGEAFGYWRFFPAPDGWGRIPVWGFARVVGSRAEGIEPGLRIFGYLPMSSHFTASLARTRGGLVDRAAHRSELPPTYNQYSEAAPGVLDDHRALLRPLFMTSWLIDDFLKDQGDLGARTVVLTSASSKTALGLAWLLSRRGMKVVGLTSPRNLDFLQGLGFYDRVVPYDQAGALAIEAPVALIDFAGDRGLIGVLHNHLGDDLVHSAIIGVTHWQAPAPQASPLPGPPRTPFFAPDQIRKRAAEWGAEVLDARFAEAMAEFVEANGWLTLKFAQGPDGLRQAYDAVVSGAASPDVGLIVKL